MKTNTQIVLTQSPDVALSIGIPGLVESRLEVVGSDARVIREQPARFDVVLQRLSSHGLMPDIPIPRGLESWFAAQFATEISSSSTLMTVMTIRDELVEDVWRHRGGGWIVQPPSTMDLLWSQEQRTWLTDEFDLTPRPSPEESMQNLRMISESLGPNAMLVAFNVSTFDPAGVRFDFTEASHSIVAHRLDLELERTADDLGAAVIDIDRIVAEIGAAGAVESPATYSEEAGVVIAEDALSAINELGVEGLVLEGDVMRLDVPTYDRRTVRGRIDEWHVTQGSEVERGTPLFDLTFDNLVHRLDYAAKETNRSMSLTVLAADKGWVADISVNAGVEVNVGQTIGVVVVDESVDPPPISALDDGMPPFRVGIRVK